MKVSDALGFKNTNKEFWKCDELESEFVEIKCEIEMMKSKNKMLQDEAKKREEEIEVFEQLIKEKDFQIHCLKKEMGCF